MPNHQKPLDSSRLLSDHDRAISIRDASRLFGLPEHALRRYQSRGVVDFYKIGRSVFISENGLKALLANARVASNAADDFGPNNATSTGSRP